MPGEPPDQPVPPPSVPSGPPGPRPGDPDDVPETAGSVAVKRRSPLIPLLAVALIAVVAVVAMVVLRGDDDEAGASDPVALVRDYFDAFSSNDCDAAIDMIDSDGEPGEQDQDSMIDACRQAYEEERDSIEGARLVSADLVSQDGDRAVVRTQIVEGGQTEPSEPEDVAVIRIDGDWKIDLGGADQATDQTATTPTTAPASPDPTAPATTAPTP